MVKQNLLLLLLLVGLVVVNAQGPVTSEWTGDGNNNFHNYLNWNPEGIPNGNTAAEVLLDGAIINSISPDLINVTSLSVGVNGSSNQLNINSEAIISEFLSVGINATTSIGSFEISVTTLQVFGSLTLNSTLIKGSLINLGTINLIGDINIENGTTGIINNGLISFDLDSSLSVTIPLQNEITGVINSTNSNLNLNNLSSLNSSQIILSQSNLNFVEIGSTVSMQDTSSILSSNSNITTSNITMNFNDAATLKLETSTILSTDTNFNLNGNTSFTVVNSQAEFSFCNYNIYDRSYLNFDNTKVSLKNSQYNFAEISALYTQGQTDLIIDSSIFSLVNSSALWIYETTVQSTILSFNISDNSTVSIQNSISNFGILNMNLLDYSNFTFTNVSLNLQSSNISVFGQSSFNLNGIVEPVFNTLNINLYDQSSLIISEGSNLSINNGTNISLEEACSLVIGSNSQVSIDSSSLTQLNGALVISNNAEVSVNVPLTVGSGVSISNNAIVNLNNVPLTVQAGAFSLENSKIALTGSQSSITFTPTTTSPSVITNSNITFQASSDDVISGAFSDVTMTTNGKGSITFTPITVTLNGTKLTLSSGTVSVALPSFTLVNSTLSNSAQSYLLIFSAVNFQGTTSSLTNSGFLSLSSSILSEANSGSVSNSGNFSTPAGNKITIDAHFTNSGNATFSNLVVFNYTQNKGNTILENGNFTSPLPLIINGGQLSGSSNISTSVLMLNGIIGSNTTLTNFFISGDFNHTANATLFLAIESPESYSKFIVNGTANLQGALTVFLLNDIEKSTNITLFSFNSTNGNFSAVNFIFPSGDTKDASCQQTYYLDNQIIVNFGCPPPNKLSPGAIVAIIFGCLTFVLILAGTGFFIRKYYQNKKSNEYPPLLANN